MNESNPREQLRVTVLAQQLGIELCMINLPYGVGLSRFPPMDKVETLTVGLAAPMRESEQPAWDITNEVIDGSLALQRLARCLGKLSNLPANGPDRQRRPLKSKSFYRDLDLRRDHPSGVTIVT